MSQDFYYDTLATDRPNIELPEMNLTKVSEWSKTSAGIDLNDYDIKNLPQDNHVDQNLFAFQANRILPRHKLLKLIDKETVKLVLKYGDVI